MRPVIRFRSLVSILFLPGSLVPGQTIPEARQVPEVRQIANWPAPLLWTPPAHTRPGGARTEAAETASAPLAFVALSPCRVADTRGNGFPGAYGPPALAADATRNFTLTGRCGIPVSAAAVSSNLGALNVYGLGGDLRVFPAGGPVPLASTLNYDGNTHNIANAAIVPLGTGGAITVQADVLSVDLIIDVNGYYSSEGIVNSLNGLVGSIALAAGTDLTLTPNDQTLTMSANSTSTDTADTLVRRDGSRGFGAGTVTLSGNLILPFPWTSSAGTIFQGGTRLLYTLGPSSQSVFLGPGAGNFMITGTVNTAVGDSALAGNSSGGGNTAIGAGALARNNGGNFNTGAGVVALLNNTGSSNTAIGYGALVLNTSGGSNIAIGGGAGGNLTTGSNNIDIFDQGLAGESSTIRIGTQGTQTATYIAGISGAPVTGTPVLVDGNGQLGVASSSGRFKQDIHEIGDASDGLLNLRPVSFRYKPEFDPTGLVQYGLIAEEVERVYPELVTCDAVGQPQTIRYHLLVPMLLNEAQRDRKEIQDLKTRLEHLEALISKPTR